MLRAKAGKSDFYPYVAQSAWAAFCAQFAARKAASNKKLFVLVFESFSDCEIFHPRLKFFLKWWGVDCACRVLPPLALDSCSDASAFDAVCERTGTLNAMAESCKSPAAEFVLATPDSIFAPAPAPGTVGRMELKKGDKIRLEDFRDKLCSFGYFNEVLCESPGQFSVRGGVVDVYPIAARAPVRIDFFGDEIDAMRTFNPDTQLGDDRILSARIDAVPPQSLSSGERCGSEKFSALDYLPKSGVQWMFFEPSSLESKFQGEFLYSEDSNFDKPGFQRVFDRQGKFGDCFCAVSAIDLSGESFSNAVRREFDCEDMSAYSGVSFDDEIGVERFNSESKTRSSFLRRLADWSASGADVFIAAESKGDEENARRMFAAENIKCSFKFINGNFGDGFIIKKFPADFVRPPKIAKSARSAVFASCREVFGRRAKPSLEPRRRMFSYRAQVDQLLDFSELGEGDYVVHFTHGICRYHGVVKLDLDGSSQEVMKLEFEDSAMLYLPLHKAHLLSRYIGLDKRHPKLARLDSKSWIKVKAAAELATLDYAAELLEMQSKREIAQGHAFPPDGDWQRSFDDSFPYAETPDQLRAIEEVKADMQASRPMERLLCADVGFGKTEVAMRAAFKAAMDGKQTAILCPTTILCQQHFRNFRERMSGYPIVVEMLSRFRTKSEAEKIKRQLAAGQIDIIIGTHALLAADVNFKDLGLLVIDEEHRFGVKHKEKIKRMREGIDVLSMSATPIPRTLYFAMMGARAISLMETPPKNRFPVETFVREYSDEIVREAVLRETSRGGQVFYLHNRVKTIDSTAEKLRSMFPNLRIGVGHGQMTENALEKLMADFVDGKYDILVCTTIIESGLDIPNCNTIIIEGADKFGLAQLYQLRGRVGRFTRRAYAWLLLHRHANLVESARKRLGAIRQYNKPGAGFRIATRDLQLRGCGNLLGAKQSGHIAGVGFDLYCALLKRSIALLRGEKNSGIVRANVNLDFVAMGDIEKSVADVSQAENYFQEIKLREITARESDKIKALVPRGYVPQTQLRVDIYRKLAMAASEDEVDKIKFEIEDRYGKCPVYVEYLFMLAKIRVLAESLGFIGVETQGDNLKLQIRGGDHIEYFRINGRFPRLTRRKAVEKLAEIENFLKTVVPSIRKT